MDLSFYQYVKAVNILTYFIYVLALLNFFVFNPLTDIQKHFEVLWDRSEIRFCFEQVSNIFTLLFTATMRYSICEEIDEILLSENFDCCVFIYLFIFYRRDDMVRKRYLIIERKLLKLLYLHFLYNIFMTIMIFSDTKIVVGKNYLWLKFFVLFSFNIIIQLNWLTYIMIHPHTVDTIEFPSNVSLTTTMKNSIG